VGLAAVGLGMKAAWAEPSWSLGSLASGHVAGCCCLLAGRIGMGQSRCWSGGNQTVAALHMWGDSSATLVEFVSFLQVAKVREEQASPEAPHSYGASLLSTRRPDAW